MKRLFWAFAALALMCAPAFALSDEEQNAGFVEFTTTTYTVRPDAITYIYREAPASDTTWLTGHPDCQYIVLPEDCRGFQLNAFGNDLIVNHPANIATGDVFAGVKVTAGSSLKWENLDLDQRTIKFGILSNSTDTATMTISGW